MKQEDKETLKKVNENIALLKKQIQKLEKSVLTKGEKEELKALKQTLLSNLLIKNRIIIANKSEQDVLNDIRREYKKVLSQVQSTLKIAYQNLKGARRDEQRIFYTNLIREEQKIREKVEANLKMVENTGIDKLDKELNRVFMTQYTSLEDNLQKYFGFTGSFGIIRPEMIKNIIYFPFAGEIWSNRWGKITEDVTKAISSIFTRGLIRGDSVDDMTRQVKALFTTKNINSPEWRVRTLVRTEIHRVMTEANNMVYENVKDGIKGWLYMATLDSATCRVCGGYDGMYFQGYYASKPVLPQHPNCRCEYLPVFDEKNIWGYKRGYRDLETGKWKVNSNYLSYRDYLKGLLGKSKSAGEFIKKYPNIAKNLGIKKIRQYYAGSLNFNDFFAGVGAGYKGILPGQFGLGKTGAKIGYGKVVKNVEEIRTKYNLWQNALKDLRKSIDALPEGEIKEFEKRGLYGPSFDKFWEAKRLFKEFYLSLDKKAQDGFKRKFFNDFINTLNPQGANTVAKYLKTTLNNIDNYLKSFKRATLPIPKEYLKKVERFVKGYKRVFGFSDDEIKQIVKNVDMSPFIKKIDKTTPYKMLKYGFAEIDKKIPVDFLYDLAARRISLRIIPKAKGERVLGIFANMPYFSSKYKKLWDIYTPVIGLNRIVFLDKSMLLSTIVHEIGHFSNAVLLSSPSVKGMVLKWVKINYPNTIFASSEIDPLFLHKRIHDFWTKKYLGVSYDYLYKDYKDLWDKGFVIGGGYPLKNEREVISTEFERLFSGNPVHLVHDAEDMASKVDGKHIDSFSLYSIWLADRINIERWYNKNMGSAYKKFTKLFTENEFITV